MATEVVDRTADDEGDRGGAEPTSALKERNVRFALGALAAILVVVGWKLPIWQAHLTAPQYPKGLHLSASGAGVVGDIREINELNHYVGMSAFADSDAPEIKLWTPVILLGLLAVGVSTFLPRRHWLGRLARIGLWLIPIGALLDVQFRLYQYGHSVQPDAPIRLDPFMPLVVGPTHVLNFTTWSYPGPSLWCLFGAAFVVSFGPWAVRRTESWWATRGEEDEEGGDEPEPEPT
jgi:hypothetical protein